jgi:hypothetical protein
MLAGIGAAAFCDLLFWVKQLAVFERVVILGFDVLHIIMCRSSHITVGCRVPAVELN